MRIVGGRLKGRSLAGPRSNAIRPTSDRLRESLFNILKHAYGLPESETRVLDLFAGTGALGFEAISRGAAHALFVESGVEGRGLIRTNIETLGLTGVTRLLRRDATDLGRAGTILPFDLVFCDPPYGKGLGERALSSAAAGGWLKAEALCVVEERAGTALEPPGGFELLERREAGDSQLGFFRLLSSGVRVARN
jgi:16S rRNA (guanine966-N2)-methyltransferase